MIALYPLRFRPLFRRYLWGGRGLATSLGKHLPAGDDWAESWEIVDHGGDQSVIEYGALAGVALHEVVERYGQALLGEHFSGDGFPLLLKFLDAHQTLSVQVHPDDARAARLVPPASGKTEAWIVLEAEPESILYAGLKAGVGRNELATALREGRCAECLHAFQPSVGDCIYIPAGTVHALGRGLLVAEIQQSSDVTYRLFDWNRVGADGQPRALHIDQALDAIDYSRGPIGPQRPSAAEHPCVRRLVDGEKFILNRWTFDVPLALGGDGHCHVIAVLQGAAVVEREPSGTALRRGESMLLPAGAGRVEFRPIESVVLVDAHLPPSGQRP